MVAQLPEHGADQSAKESAWVSRAAKLNAIAAKLHHMLGKPIQYKVTNFPRVTIREMPSTAARALGELSFGAVVLGYPTGRWLELSRAALRDVPGLLHEQPGDRPRGEADTYWVLLDGAELGKGHLLAPKWAETRVTAVFAEALHVTWPGIDARCVTYSVQWRTEDGGDAGPKGHVPTVDTNVSLFGLPHAAKMQVRVIARISEPTKGADIGLLGQWIEVALKTMPIVEDNADPFCANVNPQGGACAKSHCPGYIGPDDGDLWGTNGCRRCGEGLWEHDMHCAGSAPAQKAPNEELGVGSRVEAWYCDKWYLGVVVGCRADAEGQWQVQCDVDQNGTLTWCKKVRPAPGLGEGSNPISDMAPMRPIFFRLPPRRLPADVPEEQAVEPPAAQEGGPPPQPLSPVAARDAGEDVREVEVAFVGSVNAEKEGWGWAEQIGEIVESEAVEPPPQEGEAVFVVPEDEDVWDVVSISRLSDRSWGKVSERSWTMRQTAPLKHVHHDESDFDACSDGCSEEWETLSDSCFEPVGMCPRPAA